MTPFAKRSASRTRSNSNCSWSAPCALQPSHSMTTLLSDEPEVDLVAADMGVELGLRQRERVKDLGHQRFEIAVDRFVAERPTFQRVAQRDDPVATMLRVPHESCTHRSRRDKSINHEPHQRGIDAARIDRTKVDQRPQWIGCGDAEAPHRSQLALVARAMNHDAGQASLATSSRQDDVDRDRRPVARPPTTTPQIGETRVHPGRLRAPRPRSSSPSSTWPRTA